ncbi:MAG TPA: pyridoxine 5'-phosphate synthase [Tepidisphaeraceae bacterium]|jgi:pyridoxine 5-phosphate synthase
MIELGVNIDHVATLRQARRTYEPDPVWAAVEAELGGADGITVHLREDRRHINDRDVRALRESVQCKLNLEMSIAPEIVEIAGQILPDQATIVPERRQEITTEGGIDLSIESGRITNVVAGLKARGVYVSAFIEPDERQIDLAAKQGFHAVELHTGAYANAEGESARQHLDQLIRASAHVREHGMRLHAGHGLNYHNVGPIAAIPDMAELNIGHAIVSRAIFTGLRKAVKEMKKLLDAAPKPQLTTDN